MFQRLCIYQKIFIVIELLLRGFCSKIVAFKYVSSDIIMPIEGNTYLNIFRDFFPLKIIVRNSLLISHNVYFCTMDEENTTIKTIYFDL